nr:hypothetical protein [Tanacetum cinerariifolium]
MTRQLTVGQPPLTDGPVVVNGGSAVVNDGPPPTTIVDRRSPPLTAEHHRWPPSLIDGPTTVDRQAATWHINHELQVQYEEECSIRGRSPRGGSPLEDWGLYSLAIKTCTKKLLGQ